MRRQNETAEGKRRIALLYEECRREKKKERDGSSGRLCGVRGNYRRRA